MSCKSLVHYILKKYKSRITKKVVSHLVDEFVKKSKQLINYDNVDLARYWYEVLREYKLGLGYVYGDKWTDKTSPFIVNSFNELEESLRFDCSLIARIIIVYVESSKDLE